jgi:hypothetical protein
MNYKKILNNKLLILIDKGFRLLGFYTILGQAYRQRILFIRPRRN